MPSPPPLPASRAQLDALRPLVERIIGRQMRQAEQVVDVFRITGILDRAKDELEQAIRREQVRAVHRALRTGAPVRLDVRVTMLKILDGLFQAGRREAVVELDRAGYTPVRRYAADPERDDHLDAQTAKLKAKLGGLAIRIHNQHVVELELADQGVVADALAKALIDVLGARSVAADLVSTAMFSGMGATFEENQDLIGGWEYSAVLDGGTCDECEAHDGETFESWDEIQDVLPDGGPNPDCFGGDRCRCRAVPAPA